MTRNTRTTLRLLTASLTLALLPSFGGAEDRGVPAVSAVLDAFVDGVSRGDSEALGALYADDAHFEDVTLGQVYEGRIAIEQSWFTLLSAHVEPPRLEISRRVSVAGHGVLELIYRGRIDGALVGAPGTTREYELSMVALLDIADGKIVRQTDYLDLDRYRALVTPVPAASTGPTPSR